MNILKAFPRENYHEISHDNFPSSGLELPAHWPSGQPAKSASGPSTSGQLASPASQQTCRSPLDRPASRANRPVAARKASQQGPSQSGPPRCASPRILRADPGITPASSTPERPASRTRTKRAAPTTAQHGETGWENGGRPGQISKGCTMRTSHTSAKKISKKFSLHPGRA